MVSRSALAYLHIRWNDLPLKILQTRRKRNRLPFSNCLFLCDFAGQVIAVLKVDQSTKKTLNNWKISRKKNISCCSEANSNTDLWREEIFPGRRKYFTTALIFYSFCQSGDATFTITATKTVCNWVKNKSQIQRNQIQAKIQNYQLSLSKFSLLFILSQICMWSRKIPSEMEVAPPH